MSEQLRILVVEDEPSISRVVMKILEPRGYVVLLATSADEARPLLAAIGDGFHCALIDVGLPDVYGVDLAKEIRAAHPSVPIILMTGARDPFPPVFGVLLKPFTPEELIAAVA
jgi:DNA-binding response OmpR family regulator